MLSRNSDAHRVLLHRVKWSGGRAENKLTKYGHFIPFVVVYLHEIERLRPTDRRHLQDRIS